MINTAKKRTPEEVLRSCFFATLDRIDNLDREKQDRDAVNKALYEVGINGFYYYSTIDKDKLPKELQLNAFLTRLYAVTDKYKD